MEALDHPLIMCYESSSIFTFNDISVGGQPVGAVVGYDHTPYIPPICQIILDCHLLALLEDLFLPLIVFLSTCPSLEGFLCSFSVSVLIVWLASTDILYAPMCLYQILPPIVFLHHHPQCPLLHTHHLPE